MIYQMNARQVPVANMYVCGAVFGVKLYFHPFVQKCDVWLVRAISIDNRMNLENSVPLALHEQ